MLRHAGALARELFEDSRFEPALSSRTESRVEAVVPIREKRESRNQELSFGARPFIFCGLPIRRLPAGTLNYTRRNGRFFLEIVGHPEFGIPFGQDRLLLLWLATTAVRRQTPIVHFESAAQILEEWRLPTNGAYYRRLADAFKRVFASTMYFGASEDNCGFHTWHCDRVHFFDQIRLWFRREGFTGKGREENLVTLSAPFWTELKNHPIPVDADVIRALANNPGCLDLYTWLTWRCYQAKGMERIPLFGPLGLVAQLGIQEYTRDRKFRERVRAWLKLVRLYWPECPAEIDSTGKILLLDRANSITTSR